MSTESPVSQLITLTHANLLELIKLKDRQYNQMLSEKKGDTTDAKAITFKQKHYREWVKMLASCQPPDSITLDTLADYLKNTLKYPASLISKISECRELGNLAEIADLHAKLAIIDSATAAAKIQKTAEPATNPAAVQEQESRQMPLNESQATGTSITPAIEAIPKKLAAEGDRPDDSDPKGQKIYDLRVLHGFGDKKAIEFVEMGCTRDILLNDWATYITHPASNGGILDSDQITMEMLGLAGTSETKFTPTKLFAMKEEFLRNNMAKVSAWLPKLHHDQLVGIKYFADISQKIPRAEIQKIERFCQACARSLNPAFELMCCGSYRRGRERSGDVDCLMMHSGLKTPEDIAKYEAANGSVIQAIVKLLKAVGFIKDYFAIGETKFMGICRLPDNKNGTYTVYRHIDIRFVPYNSRGPAMLYFTGSFEYNKQMRQKANERGYMLSEYGIFKFAKDKSGKKIKGEQVMDEFTTEEAVCKWLGIPFLEPAKRDI